MEREIQRLFKVIWTDLARLQFPNRQAFHRGQYQLQNLGYLLK